MKKEVVITGLGVLSPIGISQEEYWNSLLEGKSGVRPIESIKTTLPKRLGAEVPEFQPKDYVKPKKNIKVMSRDIQLGFVAVAHACANAGLITEGDGKNVDPERFGVVFGSDLIGLDLGELVDAFHAGVLEGRYDFNTWGDASTGKILPLWMLKYLPNMPACHIGISVDARGPNNTPTLERGSALAAMIEAASVIARGDADVMICGSCGNRISPTIYAHAASYHVAPDHCDPDRVPRPYDAERNGTIIGEGAGAFILESEEFAKARGAKPLARLCGSARVTVPGVRWGTESEAVARAAQTALADASLTVSDLDHVNADGLGTVEDDAAEAVGLRKALGDLPVFTGKGHFGNLGSGSGSVELVASLLAMQKGQLPAVRNCDRIADDCPIQVNQEVRDVTRSHFMKLNSTNMGRSFAVVLEKY
ncbi:MAG: beta-ketoacyl-[acyl-carrier-protein] synthase family protein [Planctomycetia bacterium]|nr:beta-ketoacyl-[acyl-carrier-protein] synthase family protein [Planctomycetia bacterium]